MSTAVLPEGLDKMAPDAQIQALKDIAARQSQTLKEVIADKETMEGQLDQIRKLLEAHYEEIPADIPDEDLKDEVLIMLMASGKSREEAMQIVEKTMAQAAKDPMIKKGLI